MDLTALQAIPFFTGFDRSRRLKVLALSKRHDFRTGETLFGETQASRGLIMLSRGTVRLVRSANGHKIPLGEAKGPVTLMTVGLFDGGVNGMSAIAVTDCEAYLLRRADFERLCLTRTRVYRGLLREFAGRQRELTSLMEMIAGSSVRERLARVLVDMAADAKSADVVLPCSQGPFAACLGTVREVLSRSLKHMQEDGLIEVDGVRIVIRDMVALRKAAGAAMTADFVNAQRALTPCFTDRAAMQ